jgi:hypothetical protein
MLEVVGSWRRREPAAVAVVVDQLLTPEHRLGAHHGHPVVRDFIQVKAIEPEVGNHLAQALDVVVVPTAKSRYLHGRVLLVRGGHPLPGDRLRRQRGALVAARVLVHNRVRPRHLVVRLHVLLQPVRAVPYVVVAAAGRLDVRAAERAHRESLRRVVAELL